MKKTLKSVLALTLSLVLCCGLMLAGAYAADPQPPEGSPTSVVAEPGAVDLGQYCVVRDSKADGTWGKVIDGEAFYAAILTDTGVMRTYEIDSVFASDGVANMALTNESNPVLIPGQAADLGNTPVYITAVSNRNQGADKHGYPIDGVVFSFEINDDGKLVLFVPDFMDESLASDYANGDGAMSVSTLGNKLLPAASVAFLKDNESGVWYCLSGLDIPAMSQVGTGGVSGILGTATAENDALSAVALASVSFSYTPPEPSPEPEPPVADPGAYCVIQESKADGEWGRLISGETFFASIMTNTGAKKTYEIDSVYASDGITKLALTDEANAASGRLDQNKAYITAAADLHQGEDKHGYPINDLVFGYTFTDDGKVVLFAPEFMDMTLAQNYQTGAATMSLSSVGKKRVDATTVAFIKNNVNNTWNVYTGRSNIRSVAQMPGSAGGVSAILGTFIDNQGGNVEKAKLAAVALASADFISTTSNEKYGFVLSCSAAANADGTVYYHELTVFDGEQIVTYKGINGPRAVSDGQVKLASVNIPECTVIKYTLDGDRIDTITFVNSLTWNRASSTNNPDGFYTGYVAKATTDTVTVYQDSNTTTLPGSFSLDNGIYVLVYNGSNKEDWHVYSGAEAKHMINTQDEIADRFLDGWHSYTFVGHDSDNDGALDWVVMLNDAMEDVDKERYEISTTTDIMSLFFANLAVDKGDGKFAAVSFGSAVSIDLASAADTKLKITVPNLTYKGKSVTYVATIPDSLKEAGMTVERQLVGSNFEYIFTYPRTNTLARAGTLTFTANYDGAAIFNGSIQVDIKSAVVDPDPDPDPTPDPGTSTGSSSRTRTDTVSRNNSTPLISGNTVVTVDQDSEPPLAEAKTKSAHFDDVGESWTWAFNEIDSLFEKGVVKGVAEREFAPAADISRGDFMLMLVRAFDLKAEFSANFADVAESDYYYEAIGIAKELGIAKGDGANFNPKSPITRQDMMVLADRTLQTVNKPLPRGGESDLAPFADSAKVADYARDSVAALIKSGIVKGSGNALDPLGNTTRAQMAVVLYRVLENIAVAAE